MDSIDNSSSTRQERKYLFRRTPAKLALGAALIAVALGSSACVTATDQGAPGKTATVTIDTNSGQALFSNANSASSCNFRCVAPKSTPVSAWWEVIETLHGVQHHYESIIATDKPGVFTTSSRLPNDLCFSRNSGPLSVEVTVSFANGQTEGYQWIPPHTPNCP